MNLLPLRRTVFSAYTLTLAFLTAPVLQATTMMPVEVTCAVCSTKSTQNEIMSTNTMGAPDLDLRPAEMRRSTMEYWVQECPQCGYCASTLSESQTEATATVKTEAYQAQLKNRAFPPLANRFLCQMLIADKAGATNGAVHAALCAAWACDDGEKDEQAKFARTAALERLGQLKAKGEFLYEQKGADEIVLADLARRTGQFTVAAEHARKGMELKPEGIIAQVLNYELHLAEEKDSRAHTIGEMPQPEESATRAEAP